MKVKFTIVLLLGIIVLFPSCTGVNGAVQKPENTGTSLSSISSIASIEEMYDGGYWVTRPSNSVIPVVGIAGRRADKDAALADALADAARKAALYHGVYGETVAVLNQGSGNLDYFSDTDYRLQLENDPENYIGDLVFDKDNDVLERNGAVFVLAHYSGVSAVPSYNSVMKDGVPNWVIDFGADVPGFLTAVSYSKNKGSPQKTYQASYENAIVSLLPRLTAKTVNEIIDVQGVKINQNISASSGTVENVMILETWLDKKTGAVWTLLVARQRT